MALAVPLWVRPLNQPWTRIENGERRGIYAEGIRATADESGPATLTATIRRRGSVAWPDLAPLSDVIAEMAGVGTFLGRIRSAPGDERDGIVINAEGEIAKLDDATFQRTYRHTDLRGWVDSRAIVGNSLAQTGYALSGNVHVGDGKISLGWGANDYVFTDQRVGVVLDLGPDSRGKTLKVTWTRSGQVNFHFRGGFITDPTAVETDINEFLNNVSVTSPIYITDSVGARYVILYMRSNFTGYISTLDAQFIEITAVEIAAETTYCDGSGTNLLTPGTIIRDAIPRSSAEVAARGLTLVDDGSGNPAADWRIPHYATNGDQTARTVIDSVNTFLAYQFRIRPDGIAEYRAKPTVPLYAASEAWPGFDFRDASAGNIEEVYNRAILEGHYPNGQRLRRIATQAATIAAAGVQPVNGTFEDSPLTGWTAAGVAPNVGTTGTITRSTAVFDGGIASGQLAITGGTGSRAIEFSVNAWTASLVVGRTYELRFRMRIESSVAGDWLLSLRDAASATIVSSILATGGKLAGDAGYTAGTWKTFAIPFVATETTHRIVVKNTLLTANGTIGYIDSLVLWEQTTSFIDLHGIIRPQVLTVRQALTDLDADQLLNAYLNEHRTQPFRGTVSAQGRGAVRMLTTGEGVHPAHLLLAPGERLVVLDAIDPDTGAVGRSGRIIRATYDNDAETTTLDLDDSRTDLDTFLSRLDVVAGEA